MLSQRGGCTGVISLCYLSSHVLLSCCGLHPYYLGAPLKLSAQKCQSANKTKKTRSITYGTDLALG